MGYSMQNGRWADTIACNLFGTRTLIATANGEAIELGDRGTARLTLHVVAAEPGGTLDVSIQTSETGQAWRAAGAFAQTSAPGLERKCFTGLDRFVRALATVGGANPSFTVAVEGEAV